MSDLNAYWLLQRAHSHLGTAKDELNRPSEAIVTFSVCQQSKNVLSDFLRSFLLLNGIKTTGLADLESLRMACSLIDTRFEQIDLSCMSCHPTITDGNDHYCLDIERVRKCLDIADQVKKTVDDAFRNKEK